MTDRDILKTAFSLVAQYGRAEALRLCDTMVCDCQGMDCEEGQVLWWQIKLSVRAVSADPVPQTM